jgi:predicted nucleotidyltransferase
MELEYLSRPSRARASFSLLYHDIFDYPLTKQELHRWEAKGKSYSIKYTVYREGKYYFLKGRRRIIKLRKTREKISKKKLGIARKATKVLQKIPTILFVGVTGSVAMLNADVHSDVDILIITRSNTLWITRLIVYMVCSMSHMAVRTSNDSNEKDKLCFNMWLDENYLYFGKHNHFIAHEIVQIVPLVNKEKIYERLLRKNKWVKKYWPNALRYYKAYSTRYKGKQKAKPIYTYLNKLAYYIQYQLMKAKLTRETVAQTRALFHPFDWSKRIEMELQKRL